MLYKVLLLFSIAGRGRVFTLASLLIFTQSMYAFMAKSEELNNQMRPMHQTAHKIKEIKRLLDIFETQTNKMLVNNK